MRSPAQIEKDIGLSFDCAADDAEFCIRMARLLAASIQSGDTGKAGVMAANLELFARNIRIRLVETHAQQIVLAEMVGAIEQMRQPYAGRRTRQKRAAAGG